MFIGRIQAKETARPVIEKFKNERSAEVKGATVNRGLSCRRPIFNRAIEWGGGRKEKIRLRK